MMTPDVLYSVVGLILFGIGLFGVIATAHIIRLLIAINIMGIGVFMVLLSAAYYSDITDPIPHALVLTGIVVAIAGTALCLWLAVQAHVLSDTSHRAGDSIGDGTSDSNRDAGGTTQ